jgi:hypothetical protein
MIRPNKGMGDLMENGVLYLFPVPRGYMECGQFYAPSGVPTNSKSAPIGVQLESPACELQTVLFHELIGEVVSGEFVVCHNAIIIAHSPAPCNKNRHYLCIFFFLVFPIPTLYTGGVGREVGMFLGGKEKKPSPRPTPPVYKKKWWWSRIKNFLDKQKKGTLNKDSLLTTFPRGRLPSPVPAPLS